MLVYLFDGTELPRVIETPGGLNEWYRLTGAGLIGIQEIELEGRLFDCIVDDEIIYKTDTMVTVLADPKTPLYIGACVICRCDKEGNECGLLPSDIELIKRHIVGLSSKPPKEPKRWAALMLNK